MPNPTQECEHGMTAPYEGARAKIGTPVKAGFLTLYVVGHISRQGRLLRNAVGTEFYTQLHYNGVHKCDLNNDHLALTIARNAAPLDPIVASALANLIGRTA